MTDYAELLRALENANVKFIVVGGLAAISHGSSSFTQDVDIVYERSPENMKRLVEALGPHAPYLRGAPPGLPFLWDEETILRGLNFTLTTDLGLIDLLGEIAGGGDYTALLPHSFERDVYGRRCRILDLPTLIHVKRAAGRPKDFEAIAILEALYEEQLAAESEQTDTDSP